MRRVLVLAMVVLGSTGLAAPTAFADSQVELLQYKYPRPAGVLCPTVGGGECWVTNPRDPYRQRVKDTGSGSGWGWMYTPTRQHTVHMNPTCWYAYKSYEEWRTYGSPVGMRICVRVGAEWAEHEFSRMRFADLPEVDRQHFEPDRFLVTEFRARTGMLISDQPVAMQLIEGSKLQQYCDHFTARDVNGTPRRGIALDRTPGSIMQACGLRLRVSDLPPEPPNDDWSEGDDADEWGSDDDGEYDFTIPGSALRCGAIASRSQRIGVRSSRHGCTTARSVLRSYARSLRSPRGWTCAAVVRDSGTRARCSQRRSGRAKAAAAVYGIWAR